MRSYVLVSLAVAGLTVSGCGEGPPEETYPASGRATFNGEPVNGAMITTLPESGGRPGTARSDENGEFEFSTFAPGDGLIAGAHKITVTLTNPGESMIIAGRPSKNGIPNRYSMPDQTPFRFEVNTDGDNQFELVMTRDQK